MKKRVLLSVIIIAAILLANCATNETKEAKNPTLLITLEGNPTTGYMWDYTTDGEGEIALESLDAKATDSTLIGSPSTFTYSFYGTKEGNVTLIFEYARPWEGGEKLKTETYKLYVNKDLEIELL